MKKIVLSAVTIATLTMSGLQADSTSDIAEMKAMMKQMSQRLAKLETENKHLKASKKTEHKKAKSKKYVSAKKKKSISLAESVEKTSQ